MMKGADLFNAIDVLMDCLTKCEIYTVNGKTVRIQPRKGYYHPILTERRDMVEGVCGFLKQLRDEWRANDGD